MNNKIIPTLLFLSTVSYSQKDKKSEFIKSFFEDVFINDKPMNYMFEKYGEKKYHTVPQDSAIHWFSATVEGLKKEKSYLVNKDVVFTVEPYDDCSKPELRDFSAYGKKGRKKVFVVSVGDKIERYVFTKNSKITSFDYVYKGENGHVRFIY